MRDALRRAAVASARRAARRRRVLGAHAGFGLGRGALGHARRSLPNPPGARIRCACAELRIQVAGSPSEPARDLPREASKRLPLEPRCARILRPSDRRRSRDVKWRRPMRSSSIALLLLLALARPAAAADGVVLPASRRGPAGDHQRAGPERRRAGAAEQDHHRRGGPLPAGGEDVGLPGHEWRKGRYAADAARRQGPASRRKRGVALRAVPDARRLLEPGARRRSDDARRDRPRRGCDRGDDASQPVRARGHGAGRVAAPSRRRSR